MSTWQKILVPLDNTPLATRALDAALELAVSNGAELLVLRVHEGRPPLDDPDETERHMDRMEIETDDLVAWAHERAITAGLSGERIVGEVRKGPIVKCIVDCAEEHMADLVIMGTHGVKTFGERFLGTVTERVVRQTPVSVLVIRPLGFPYLQDVDTSH